MRTQPDFRIPLQALNNTTAGAREENGHIDLIEDDFGDDHISSAVETPMRDDAFALNDEAKIELIEYHFKKIMHVLGLDLTDDSLKGTPRRVAKMYVQEVFQGLNPKNKPSVTLFENRYHYNRMLVEKNITLYTYCEHHFVPIFGKVHVGYIPAGQVIGLSKINRIVQYFAKRPQVQERLTVQIADELRRILSTEDVAVVIDAVHLCVSSRGVQDTGSTTTTSSFLGRFHDESVRNEFLRYIEIK